MGLELAALNNARWCDAVCRAHGVPGEFRPEAWVNPHRPPPYHPNLVVTAATATLDAVRPHLQSLMSSRHPPLAPGWAVKDSFCRLDLQPLGFAVLFEAHWIRRDPAAAIPSPMAAVRLDWSPVASSAALAEWETAWVGGPGHAAAAGRPVQFPDTLLAEPEVVFFAGTTGGRLVAGGIANGTGPVVGLSNVFVQTGHDPRAAWAGLVRSVSAVFPGRRLVGYERGGDLETALACGFETAGPLRVWTRR